MAKNTDNGMLWALGAVGALALGAAVASRAGSRDSCHACGSANCAVEKEDEARGSYLLRQRFSAKAGFVVPLQRLLGYTGTDNKKGQDFLAWHKAEMRDLLLNRPDGAKEVDAYQRKLLEAAHVSPDPEEAAGARGLMTLEVYAEEKIKDWRKRHKVASKQEESEKYTEYYVSLYAKRAWCIYLLEMEALHHPGAPVVVEVKDPPVGKPEIVTLLSEAQRESVYGVPPKDENGNLGTAPFMLLGHITFTLTVPRTMPPSVGLPTSSVQTYADFDRRLQALPIATPPKATAFPMRVGRYVASALRADLSALVEGDGAQEADLLEDVGEDEDAELMKGLSGAPILAMYDPAGQPVGFFFLALVSGSMAFPYGMKTIALVTCTSKMASPSFGLPAGGASSGGTCPSGDIGLPTSSTGKQSRRQAAVFTPEVAAAIARREKLIDGIKKRIVNSERSVAGGPRMKVLTQVQKQDILVKNQSLRAEIVKIQGEIKKLIQGIYIPVKKSSQSDKLVPAYICAVCYAMGANYGYANNMIQQAARAKWIKDSLKGEEGIRRGAGNLAQMIWTYANDTKHGERACQEIGVWSSKRGAILTPKATNREQGEVAPTSLRISKLTIKPVAEGSLQRVVAQQGLELAEDTQIFFSKLAAEEVITNGAVAGFFRLHDSGDFGIGATYQKAWLAVAKAFPGVQFWAPTRQWGQLISHSDPRAKAWDKRMLEMANYRSGPSYVLRKWRRGSGTCWKDALQGELVSKAVTTDLSPGEALSDKRQVGSIFTPIRNLAALADIAALPNFTLRPSSLYVRRTLSAPIAIPFVPGLSAGSGVAAKLAETGDYPVMNDTRGVQAYQCPVYTKMSFEQDGGKIIEKEAKSCRTANCRACWLAKDLPVFYGAH